MFKVTKYPQGTFCWIDCTSTDAAKAKDFYAALMGWGTNDLPIGGGMVYTMFTQDGEDVAAISQMMPEQAQQGIPSAWNHYIAVDDVDAIAPKVTELGGTVIVPPMDVFDNGRMMTIQDPSGAIVSLWQARSHKGSGLVNTVGAPSWNELATRDVAAAKKFFGSLLGWEFQDLPEMNYTTFTNNGRLNGGIIEMNEQWEGMPPHWMIYFGVADTDAACDRVKKLGGQVHVPPTDIPAGRFAVISDPAGAVMTIMKLNNPDPWVE